MYFVNLSINTRLCFYTCVSANQINEAVNKTNYTASQSTSSTTLVVSNCATLFELQQKSLEEQNNSLKIIRRNFPTSRYD